MSSTLGQRLDPRANSLNFLRLLLAMTVIVSHAWPLGDLGDEPLLAGRSPGGFAVYGFFALSGYLITGSRLNSGLGDFLKRRLLRLYPAFVACLVMTVAVFAPLGYLKLNGTLDGYATTGTTPLDYLASSLDLRMNGSHIANTPTNGHGWTVTLWSLYYEFLCYLVVAGLAFWPAFRRSWRVSAGLLTLVSLAQIYESTLRSYTGNADLLHMVDLLPFFLAGALAYQVRDRMASTWWTAALSAALVVAVPLALGARFVVLTAFPMAWVLLWLGAVLPVRLGRKHDISYGFYLYSGPVQALLWVFGVAEHGLAVYVILSIAGTVPFAAASWFLVERRAMRLGRRRPASLAAVPPHTVARATAVRRAHPAVLPVVVPPRSPRDLAVIETGVSRR
ncbi:acyltransferase [Blastococcus sp. TF02-9]|uniref:acyltransferase family protein n=1 Tax=Blastococcus sp. TF02-09 TaxID=2250576 RepID=UPI00131430F4|nr:acyltransferase [Blastococcus sp. TF02-9]